MAAAISVLLYCAVLGSLGLGCEVPSQVEKLFCLVATKGGSVNFWGLQVYHSVLLIVLGMCRESKLNFLSCSSVFQQM